MTDYTELVKSLRICANEKDCVGCKESTNRDSAGIDLDCLHGENKMVIEVADAIEELQKEVEREKAFKECWEEMAQDCKARFQKLVNAFQKYIHKPSNNFYGSLRTGLEQAINGECRSETAGTSEPPRRNRMDEEVVFIKQKDMCELILKNLFSDETEKFFNNCSFTSDRMAFMQGMNYAALLCNARLEKYLAIIHHTPPKEET